MNVLLRRTLASASAADRLPTDTCRCGSSMGILRLGAARANWACLVGHMIRLTCGRSIAFGHDARPVELALCGIGEPAHPAAYELVQIADGDRRKRPDNLVYRPSPLLTAMACISRLRGLSPADRSVCCPLRGGGTLPRDGLSNRQSVPVWGLPPPYRRTQVLSAFPTTIQTMLSTTDLVAWARKHAQELTLDMTSTTGETSGAHFWIAANDPDATAGTELRLMSGSSRGVNQTVT
jgi:hypothetical protein